MKWTWTSCLQLFHLPWLYSQFELALCGGKGSFATSDNKVNKGLSVGGGLGTLAWVLIGTGLTIFTIIVVIVCVRHQRKKRRERTQQTHASNTDYRIRYGMPRSYRHGKGPQSKWENQLVEYNPAISTVSLKFSEQARRSSDFLFAMDTGRLSNVGESKDIPRSWIY